MKRDDDVAERDALAVRQGIDADVWPEAAFEQTARRLGAQVRLAAGPGVVTVDVRDQCALDRSPGIEGGSRRQGRKRPEGLSISI